MVACNVLKLSGALAFFTVFSLPGLLIIVIWFSDLFYSRNVVEETVYKQIEGFVGHSAAVDIQETIQAATLSRSGDLPLQKTILTIAGIFALIISGSYLIGACKKTGSSWLHPISQEIPEGFPTPNHRFQDNPLSEEGFELGRRLFYDGRLSVDGMHPAPVS